MSRRGSKLDLVEQLAAADITLARVRNLGERWRQAALDQARGEPRQAGIPGRGPRSSMNGFEAAMLGQAAAELLDTLDGEA